VRFSAGIHDADPIDRARYDEDALPRFRESGVSVEESIKIFWEEWRRTGLCPDPRMYEVVHSTWIDAVGAAEDFKHFIIAGHDSYVEVIAKAWRYESLGVETWPYKRQGFTK
jgi:hypothetical protein